jgi:hypothetical protein
MRMPGAIAAALILLAVLTILTGIFALFVVAGTAKIEFIAVYGVAFLASAYSMVGTWFGWLPAMVTSVGLGGVLVLGGLFLAVYPDLAIRLLGYDTLGYVIAGAGALLAGLVVVPQASRDWFLLVH